MSSCAVTAATARAARSPCSRSTRPATPSCCGPPTPCARTCGPPTSSPASAAACSPFSCRRRTRSGRCSPPSACGRWRRSTPRDGHGRPPEPAPRIALGGGIAACPQDAQTVDELLVCARGALAFARRQGLDVCAVASRQRDVSDGDLVTELRERAGELEVRHGVEGHGERVAASAVALAAALGLEVARTIRLRRVAVLLDVGSVAVDSDVLATDGPLGDDEFAQVRVHPLVGAAMLRHAGLVEEAGWLRAHHERPDGRGYPDGLRGREAPIEARILAVAEAFEALRAARPHRQALDVDDALDEVRAGAGPQFDADVVAALAELVVSGVHGPGEGT